MSIVGLTLYERVRDFLYLRMRGARFGEDDEPETAITPLKETGDTAVSVLTEIRDELRAVRQRIEERPS